MIDINQAQTALLLCRAAYDTRLMPSGPEWSPPQFIVGTGLPGALLKESSTFGFAIQHKQKLHIAFRGTEDPGDWLCDLECAPENGLHGGIYRIYAALQASMANAIKLFPPLPIEFNGHSLGGGIGAIGQANTPGSDCFTFAAPRVFTRALARSLPIAGTRIVNERDLVPHLPGRMGVWDYEHRAEAYRFTGQSFNFLKAHSLADAYGPALSGALEGPASLE